jgi:hypothetical protein
MADLVRRQVRGTFVSADGKRLRGRVVFTPVVTVYDLEGNVVLLKRPIEANANADGLVQVDLPITDDPRHTPTGWYYTVVEQFEDGPSRDGYWLEVPAGSEPIELAGAITDQVPPKPSYALIPGPQGDAATIEVGTVTTLNPSQSPTVTNSGTTSFATFDFGLPRPVNVLVGSTSFLDANQNPTVSASTTGVGDRTLTFGLPQAKQVQVGSTTVVNPDQQPGVSDSGNVNLTQLDFQLPRAASVTVEDVQVVNPDQLPTITDVGSDGDVELEFEIPRAPSVTVGTVTTVAPTDPADVMDIGTDGDVVLDFDIPQGIKGDTGEGVAPAGLTGEILVKASDADFDTEWVSDITVDQIQFDVTAGIEADTAGQLAWNAEDGTLDLGLNGGDVVLQIGQETLYRVKNQTGSTITNGTLVQFAGTVGMSGILLAAPSDTANISPEFVMGVATEDIADGADGYVTHFGKVRGFDTSMWSDGDILYADPAVVGGLTNVEPPLPNVQVAAVVTSNVNVGEIFVRPTVRQQYETDQVPEGSANLYFTDTRADDRVRATGVTTVAHGADGTFLRPTAATVYWKGSVAPDNAVNGDLWYDTSGD